MELDKRDWNRVKAIARDLAVDVDRNELGKIVAYAQRVKDTEKVLRLVERLPRSGYVRSGRTRGYLERIGGVLRRELAGMDGERSRTVLGWAFRLMTYYQMESGTRTASDHSR